MGNFISDFVGDITGANAADAARNAGSLQNEAAGQAMHMVAVNRKRADEALQQGYGPFATDRPWNQLLRFSDPTKQQNYLNNNPMFQAALNSTNEQINRGGAITGKNVTADLFNNYLAQGQNFINNRYQQLMPLAQMGMNAQMGLGQGLASNITNSATQRADLLTGGANALAAGQVGAANARQQGTMGLLGAGLALGLAPVTGGGSLIGNMFSSQPPAPKMTSFSATPSVPSYNYSYSGPQTYQGTPYGY